MIEFKEWFLENTEWLYNIIWQTDFFYFDFWSFVHFWSGAFLIIVFLAYKVKRKWVLLSVILFTYEVFEIIIKYFVFNIFKPETFVDQITDFFVGLAGAVFSFQSIKYISSMLKSPGKKKIEFSITSFFTASTISFLWVGFYDYTNGYAPYSFTNFNYLTFGILFIFLFAILSLHSFLNAKYGDHFKFIIIVSIISAVALIFIELISHNIFSLNLISRLNDDPLLFGLLKGDTALKIFYISIGLWAIALYKLFNFLSGKAIDNILFTGTLGKDE